MEPAETNLSTIDVTVLETASAPNKSIENAARKLAIAQEQCKLLSECRRLKLGTRGVEILLAKLIHDDIIAVGQEISSKVLDLGIYEKDLKHICILDSIFHLI